MKPKTQLSRDTSKQASFFASRRGNEHNEVSQSVTNCHGETGLEAAIDAAAGIKARLNEAIGKDRALATRIALREYLPAVREIRERYTRDTLEGEHTTLEGRLDRGWELEPTPSRTRLWVRLLVRHEVLSDCLVEDPTSHLLDRIERQAMGVGV